MWNNNLAQANNSIYQKLFQRAFKTWRWHMCKLILKHEQVIETWKALTILDILSNVAF